MDGILHIYHPRKRLLLFEFTPKSTDSQTQPVPASSLPNTPTNTLLFVGGLYDNFFSPSYTLDLARLFPRDAAQAWRLMHVQLSSHGTAFGLSDINNDIDEIAVAIHYIRSNLGGNNGPSAPSSLSQPPDQSGFRTDTSNIVLMGHSTGCQDILHYLSNPSNPTELTSNKPSSNPQPKPSKVTRPPVQGAILQAPVSDREGCLNTIQTNLSTKRAYETLEEMVRSTPSTERRTTTLPTHLTTPLLGPAPISVSRFTSLTSPTSPTSPSIEDFFSSDLPDEHLERTFGNIGKSGLLRSPTFNSSTHQHGGSSGAGGGGGGEIMFLMSQNDEHVPSSIDKRKLIDRWTRIVHQSNTTTTNPTGEDIKATPILLTHAVHDVSGDDLESRTTRLWTLRKTVLEYLDRVVGGVDAGSWEVLEREAREFGIDVGDGGAGDGGEEVEKGVKSVKL